MPRFAVLTSSPSRRLASALLLACLACLAPAQARAASCSAASFKVGQSIATGDPAYQTVAADFNSDGRPDLAATSSNRDQVLVILGQGADGFGPPARFATGDAPFGLAAGDFNGDGKPDLVTTHVSANILSVLPGDGAGGFGPAATYQAPWSGQGLWPAAGDFNGDGRDDLAVGVAGQVWFLISNGAGGFTPNASSPVTVGGALAPFGGVGQIRIADFNGDGRRDVVARGEGALNVMLGDGAGNFAAPSKLLDGRLLLAVTVDDFNGDGKPDLAATELNFDSYAVAILAGNGDGTFAAPARHALAKEPSHLAAADFNGDGKKDLAVAVSVQGSDGVRTGGNLLVLSGDGAGNFSASPPIYVLPSSDPELLAADFSGDGRPDLAAAGHLAVTVYRTEANGRPAAPLLVEAGPRPGGTVAADFNNDGKPDLAFVNNWNQSSFGGGQFSVHLGDGAGGFSRSANVLTGQPNFLRSMAAADFNGDAKIDLAITSANNNTLIYLGNGDGTFAARQSASAFSSGGAQFVEAGDFNNDSKVDLLVSYGGANPNAAVFLGHGNGDFTNVSGLFFDPNGATGRFAVGDLNGDGKLDAAFASGFHSQFVHVALGDGQGNLPTGGPNAIKLPLTGRGPLDVAARDFNGDGKLDLAVSSTGTSSSFRGGFVSVALNNGAGGFGPFTDYAAAENPESITVGDFTGDGFADIATSSSADAVSVLTGDGAGGFGPGVLFTVGQSFGTNSVVAADFNGDGKNDLAAARAFASGAAVLINNFTAALPCVSVADITVAEGDTGESDAAFTVTLSEASAETVRVSYFFRDGVGIDFSGGPFIQFGAQNGVDYRGTPGTLVFAPGTTTQTVTAKIVGDQLDEFNEPFDLVLSSATNAAISRSRAVATITDDDAPPAISITDASAPEGSNSFPPNSAAFTVTLSAPSDKPVSVQFATAPGTASTNDFSTFINSLNFAPGQTSKTITVELRADLTHETDETFFVNLSGPVNASLADAQGQGTITNDDPQPTIAGGFGVAREGDAGTITTDLVVLLSNPTYQTVTVNYATVDGTATAGSDYAPASGSLSFAPGETSKTITLTINGDVADETEERFGVVLSDPTNATLGAQGTVAIVDNDGPIITAGDVSVIEGNAGFTNVTVTLSLSAPSVQDVSVRLHTAGGTATEFSDFPPVVNRFVFFPVGSTSATTTLRVNGDTVVEPDENFAVFLSNQINGTVPDNELGIITITNDDPPGTLQLSAADVAVSEAAGRATLTITRTGDASAAAAVDYQTADADTFTVGCADAAGSQGAAFARCDFATAAGTLSFAPGETTKSVTVPVIDDAHAEGPETFQLRLSNAAGAALGSLAVSTVTIQDNDAGGAPNPVQGPPHEFFVRQQYLDFLSREPDDAGFNAWLSVLNTCPKVNAPPGEASGCDRIHVSGEGFFRSTEFRLKASYAFRLYRVAFARLPEYLEIVSDMSFVAGATEAEVFARRAQLAERFTARPEFAGAYGQMSNQQYVSALLDRYALQSITTPDPSAPDGPAKVVLTRGQLTERLASGALSRAQALRAVADSDEVGAREFDNAFVAMQYYGYLRRKPEAAGFEAWLRVLQSGDVRTMVDGFLNSTEYKLRFGQP